MRNVLGIGLIFVGLLHQPVTPLIAQTKGQSSRIETTLKETDPVDVGDVIALGSDSVTVKNDLFTRVFRINGQTSIRRVDSTPLQIGDNVGIRCHFDNTGAAIADSIEANVGHWGGVITKVLKDTAYIKFDAPVKGSAKVIFDTKTEFGYCVRNNDVKRDCTVADLKVGRHLETIGFVLARNELRATRVLGIEDH
jgi:hypothetical protein